MSVFADVQSFHRVAGQATATGPSYPRPSLVGLRRALIDEEHREVHEALDDVALRRSPEHLAALAKELCDLIYVVAGTGVSIFGSAVMEEAWSEVHRSNLSKVGPGGIQFREDGKVLKPNTYSPADIEAIIRRVMSAPIGEGTPQ